MRRGRAIVLSAATVAVGLAAATFAFAIAEKGSPSALQAAIVKGGSQFADSATQAVTRLAATQQANVAVSGAELLRPQHQGMIFLSGGLALVSLIAALYFGRARYGQNPKVRNMDWLERAQRIAMNSRLQDRERAFSAIARPGAEIEPDIRRRGTAALARAHQLDIFFRYSSRAGSMPRSRSGDEEDGDWLKTAQHALTAVRISPEAKFFTAFQRAKPRLNTGDPVMGKVPRYFEMMGGLIADYERSFVAAQAELSGTVPDRRKIASHLEELRRINKRMAEEAALVIGPFEINVRTVA